MPTVSQAERPMLRINIIGSGVVGSATGIGLAFHGHHVQFVDTSRARIAELQARGLCAAVPRDVDWAAADISMISVNTPTDDRGADLSAVRAAVRTLGQGLAGSADPHVVVIRSTVPPRTTRDVVQPLLEAASGRLVGPNLGLAMNPEFLRQRSADDDFRRPWLTVFGAMGEREASLLRSLYEPFGAPIVATDVTTAEVIKYAHNLYNATKISFFNEFHLVCEELGVDSRTVGDVVSRSAEGMWRPQYGTHGGRPYNGACLPKDTRGFLSFVESLGIQMPLLRATIAVNGLMEGLQHAEAHAAAEDADQGTGDERNREISRWRAAARRRWPTLRRARPQAA
jgi:UDPglucose 6-dehydrogenase